MFDIDEKIKIIQRNEMKCFCFWREILKIYFLNEHSNSLYGFPLRLNLNVLIYFSFK